MGDLMELRSIYTLETAENVHIKVELAGLANRVFAFVLDALLMFGLLGAVMLLVLIMGVVKGSQELIRTAMPVALFVVFFGYHLFQEWLWNGKTVGKVVFKIRVVRNNGQPIGFWESFGRNLLRVVDVYSSGVGLLVMMFNRSEKRCGDFVAGTIVINDQPVTKPGAKIIPPAQSAPQISSLDSALAMLGSRLTAEETELLQAYQTRRKHFLKPARELLSQAVCRYFSYRLHQSIHSDEDLDRMLEPGHSAN